MTDKDSLDHLRKSLKKWEAAFVIVHQRKPNKEDIATAPQDIKEKYQLYHESKKGSEAKKKPTNGSCETDNVEVWGVELNKKKEKWNSLVASTGQTDAGRRQGLLDKVGAKLFQNIAASETTRKPLAHIKRDGGIMKCPVTEATDATPPSDVSQQDKAGRNSFSLVQQNKPVRTVDTDGERHSLDTSSELIEDSDLVIKGDMFKTVEKCLKKSSSVSSLQRKRSLTANSRLSFLTRDFTHLKTKDLGDDNNEVNEEALEEERETFKRSKSDLTDRTDSSNSVSNLENENEKVSLSSNDCLSGKISETLVGKTLQNQKTSTKPSLRQISGEKIPHGKSIVLADCLLPSKTVLDEFEKECKSHEKVSVAAHRKTPIRGNKIMPRLDTEPSLFQDEQGSEAASCHKVDIHSLGTDKPGPVVRTKKRKCQQLEDDWKDDGDNEPYIENEEVIETDSPECHTKLAAAKLSGPKKATVVKKSAASLNDNYVCLNMKKKGYRRKGAAGLTSAQLRRKQWKQKLSARSQSYGSNKCFKCGKEGHWANKCKGKAAQTPGFAGYEAEAAGSSADTHMNESVEESDFPSLRQAALMARGTHRKDPTDHVDVDGADITDIEASIVRERWEECGGLSTETPAAVKPLSATVDDLDQEVRRGLEVFGFSAFRPGQRDSVLRILKGLSTLVVLSTGGGKSLCYQLPAYLYAKHTGAITLVISPLVSLMEDQITGLPAGIHGACLHSNMTQTQRDSVIGALKEGKVHFLLVSPEALVEGGGSRTSIPALGQLPPIAFACVDEAHCLSEWSHNFRPSYLRLCKVLRTRYGVRCFLGLTATATRDTARDVARHLGVGEEDHAATVRGAAVPDNLVLSASRDESKDEALLHLLQGPRFKACPSIIIYCARREETTRVATLIRTSLQTEADLNAHFPPPPKRARQARKSSASSTFSPGVWTAESYHAGLSAAKRKSVQKAFMSGRLRVVAATVAFGMGLDKADVRGVIHYTMAKSFEAYVQEIGRAGRDGQEAQCHVFLHPEGRDLSELRRHTYSNSVDRSSLKKLVTSVFSPCRCADICRRSAAHAQTSNVVVSDDGQAKRTEDTSCGAADGLHPTGTDVCDLDPTLHDDPDASLVCPGHERALSIEDTVHSLDIKEEGVSTLLCYLELHYPHWVQMSSPIYRLCSIRCYGGASQLQALAKKCPPVAVAIARQKLDGKNFSGRSELEFKVVEICDAMGWDSQPVKRELRALQWVAGPSGYRKSGVLVELSDLAFHFRSRGDLTDDQMDEVLDFLISRTRCQEQTELAQLDLLSESLRRVSHKNYWMCSEEADRTRSDALKKDVEAFFDKERPVDADPEVKAREPDAGALNQLQMDTRQFISLYGQDHALTGRSIARVFHGIGSPNFPSETWGRVRRFWRAHLHVDFPVIVREATRLLVAMR